MAPTPTLCYNSFPPEVSLTATPLLWPNAPPTQAEVLQFHLLSLDGATAPLVREDLGKDPKAGGSHRVSASYKVHLHLSDPGNLGCTTQVTCNMDGRSLPLLSTWVGVQGSLWGSLSSFHTLLSSQEAPEDQ